MGGESLPFRFGRLEMANMAGYEIVLQMYSDEPANALRIFVVNDLGETRYIDLTHDAVMQLESTLKRCIDKWEKEPD